MRPFHANLVCGLGNRLKALLSLQHAGRIMHRPVSYSWQGSDWGYHASGNDLIWNHGLPCRYFRDIFDNDFTWKEGDDFLPDGFEKWRLWLRKDEIPTDFVPGDALYFATSAPNPVDLEYERTPTAAKDIYIPLFQSLVPKNKHALAIKREIESSDLNDRLVCVHIRNSSDWDGSGRHIPLERYFEVMDTFDLRYEFYVACTDPKVEVEVRNRYCERGGVHFMEKKWSGDEQYTDAVTELYSLARGKHLIASFLSTYSEVAWWLGGCRATVSVVRP